MIAGFERLEAGGDASTDGPLASTGGRRGTGGARGNGGASESGGTTNEASIDAPANGGRDASTTPDGANTVDGTGGIQFNTGGALGSGGIGTGGIGPTGGALNTGGAVNTGGVLAVTGGRTGTGGRAPTGGASSTGGALTSTGGGLNCPDASVTACATGLPGPALVRIPIPKECASYCIDSTEVTNSQYAEFLNAPDGGLPTQDSWCTWNTSYEPKQSWPPQPGQENLPVTNVDWCDASAYCKWAGKHLCGKIGGGMNATGDDSVATKSEWYNACSKEGTRIYPYGSAYINTACNDTESGQTTLTDPVPVGSMATCEGGFMGLFDMSGNVTEWENSCQTQAGRNDVCLTRGGSRIDFEVSSANRLGCGISLFNPPSHSRSSADAFTGFRCCI